MRSRDYSSNTERPPRTGRILALGHGIFGSERVGEVEAVSQLADGADGKAQLYARVLRWHRRVGDYGELELVAVGNEGIVELLELRVAVDRVEGASVDGRGPDA